MPRYEFKEGTSNKFWEIELEGESFTTRWGKIGTDGQETTKDFDSSSEAKREYHKLVDEKVKKGYKLVGGGEAAGGANTKTNPDLEAAIAANPANPEPYLVYADWLQSQGDPRGELIVVQHALAEASGPKKKELHAREKAILKANGEAWLGQAAENEERAKLGWRFGFVQSAHVSGEYDADFDVEGTLEHLFSSPVGRFLEDVTVGAIDFEGDNTYQGIIDLLVRTKPQSLRNLFLGDFTAEECEISWSHIGNTSKLYTALPKLESLILRSGDMTLGKIDLPSLKSFAVRTGGLDKGSFKAIASAKWPKLERLEIWFGSHSYGAECSVKDLEPIFEARGLENVKCLGLMNAEFTDDIVEGLVTSKILKQLTELNLSMGCLTAQGVETLKKHSEAFKHLSVLDISDNAVEEGALSGVKKICAKVLFNEQSPDRIQEDYRYPAVGE